MRRVIAPQSVFGHQLLHRLRQLGTADPHDRAVVEGDGSIGVGGDVRGIPWDGALRQLRDKLIRALLRADHPRLIERVDAHQLAGQCRHVLPQVEQLAERQFGGQHDVDDRQARIEINQRVLRSPNADEHAIRIEP